MRGTSLSVSVLALVLAGNVEALGQPEGGQPFLRPTIREGILKLEPAPTIVRQQKFVVNWRELRGPRNQRLALPVFDRAIVLVREEQSRPQPGRFVWIGAVEGQPGSLAILASSNQLMGGGQALAGYVRTVNPRGRSTHYQIRYLGRGVHVLREIDRSRFPPEGDPEPDPNPDPPAAQLVCRDSPTEIDVLVVYTDAARNAAGGRNGIVALIDAAIAQANRSYKASKVNQKLRLVHEKRVEYVESGSSRTDRNRLKGKSDGELDDVHALRDTQAADIVAMFVSKLDDCGRSYVMEDVSPAFQSKAFAVVKWDCAVDNISFAHELGHIMGARHDRADDPVEGKPFDFNHCHLQKSPTGRAAPWRTIMAKDPSCGGNANEECTERIERWSNPDVKYPDSASGDPTGTADKDNHRALNETAATVSHFRCAAGPIP